MANTLNVEMPTQAQLSAVGCLVDAWQQAQSAGFSEWMVWELQKLVHAAVGELSHTRMADQIMDNLEAGWPTPRAFSEVIEP